MAHIWIKGSKVPQQKVSYNDMQGMTGKELMSKYKMDTRTLEQQVRYECWDAPKQKMTDFYDSVYSKKID